MGYETNILVEDLSDGELGRLLGKMDEKYVSTSIFINFLGLPENNVMVQLKPKSKFTF